MEVEHVKAHRTEKDKKEMSHFEKFVTEGNEKADELAKEGALLDEGFMARQEQRQLSRSEKRCTQFCSVRPVFHCLVEEWKDCEELKPQPKERLAFVEKRGSKASNGMVCTCQQVSMHGIWKRQQVNESTRKMHRAKILVKELGKIGKATFERARCGKKSGQAR